MQAKRARGQGEGPGRDRANRNKGPGRRSGPVRRKPARTRLKPEERHAQLLEAAVRAFARRGLQRATHSDIAEECGVVVGTVFLYFPTREALLGAVLAEVERVSDAISARCYAGGAPAPDAIRCEIRELLDLVDRKPEYALVWLDWSTAVREETWPRYLAFQDRAVDTMAKSIARGQELGIVATRESPETCARLIASSTMMLAQMHFTRQPRERIEAFANAVVGMALGLRERGHRP